MINRIGLMLVFLFITSIAVTHSADLYVPSQYTTNQAAIDSASSGDTVWLTDGMYQGPGNVNLDFQGKNITVRSENDLGSCIIDCENFARFYSLNDIEIILMAGKRWISFWCFLVCWDDKSVYDSITGRDG